MDIEKLAERLGQEAYGSDIEDLLLEAATALSTLQAENEKLRAELEQVTAERDAAVRQVALISQPNDPLTLERLREMDGEPVWVTPLGFWALVIAKPGKRVQLISNDGETVWADKEIELVGPVYRRPPEGEEDT